MGAGTSAFLGFGFWVLGLGFWVLGFGQFRGYIGIICMDCKVVMEKKMEATVEGLGLRV